MSVSDVHNEYNVIADRIETTRDCVSGSDAIKSRQSAKVSSISGGIHNTAGSKYLPPPNPTDSSTDNRVRYDAYKTRALFINFTAHTKDGFLGMVNRRPIRFELASEINYLLNNSDGSGLPLRQLVTRGLGELMDAGAYGLLADYPLTEEGLSQSATRDLMATIKTYPRESIINWREEVINGEKKLTMVVLEEEVENIEADGFKADVETYHRVLLLKNGIYVQNIYNSDDELISDDIIPRKANGSAWSEIPFEFVGAVVNTPESQKPLLYDLSIINVSHYRNSADFEESSFMVGQPTPVISGLDQAWVKDILKGEIAI
jgi:hypothetical protein